MSELNGRPIEGQPIPGRQTKPQYPDAEFTEALDALLGFEGVEAVQWEQYTPYFNDGDPCVFGACEAGVRFTDTPEDAGYDGDGFLQEYELREDKVRQDAVQVFNKVLCSGHFDVLLVKTFGDHARVTATKEKFVIDSYDHD